MCSIHTHTYARARVHTYTHTSNQSINLSFHLLYRLSSFSFYSLSIPLPPSSTLPPLMALEVGEIEHSISPSFSLFICTDVYQQPGLWIGVSVGVILLLAGAVIAFYKWRGNNRSYAIFLLTSAEDFSPCEGDGSKFTEYSSITA